MRAAAVSVHADAVEGAARSKPAMGVHGGGARCPLRALWQDRQHHVQRRRQQEPGLRRIRPYRLSVLIICLVACDSFGDICVHYLLATHC